MPHRDGVYVINEIRAHAPETRVIAMSGTPRIEVSSDNVLVTKDKGVAMGSKPLTKEWHYLQL